MSKPQKEYTRLPGRGRHLVGTWLVAGSRFTCTLWMGSDHLLVVNRQGYTENYKRFYFRDIQAILIRKTNSGAVSNYITGFLGLICLAWAFGITNLPGRVTLWIIAGLFGFFTVYNLILGPTCKTHIKTAVQTEQLPAWNRLRTARKGLARIRAFILQAQPEMPVDDIKARLAENLSRQFQGPSGDAT